MSAVAALSVELSSAIGVCCAPPYFDGINLSTGISEICFVASYGVRCRRVAHVECRSNLFEGGEVCCGGEGNGTVPRTYGHCPVWVLSFHSGKREQVSKVRLLRSLAPFRTVIPKAKSVPSLLA